MTPKEFFQVRIVKPILLLLKQGVTPRAMAMSLALGIAIGISPLIGITTMLCLGLSIMFGLNLPAIQLMNWMFAPIQFALFLPFIRLGEKIFQSPTLALSSQQLHELFENGALKAVAALGRSYLQASIAWLIISPLVVLISYGILYSILKKFSVQKSANL